MLSDFIIDLWDLLCGTAHEEERDAEEGGNGQHDHTETWDGLQRETHPLHDDPTCQHPHRYSRQIHSTWESNRNVFYTEPLISDKGANIFIKLVFLLRPSFKFELLLYLPTSMLL